MMPPLLRRCPRCGRVRSTGWFDVVAGDPPALVECPACGYRFEPAEKPWLK